MSGMNEAMVSFLALVTESAPYTIAWVFGIKAYRFIVNALSGKDASI